MKNMDQREHLKIVLIYIISSNEEWVVPASIKYRRFSVMKTDDWLTNQEQEVKNNLAETDRFTFAKFLYDRDLNHFNPREFRCN